MASSKGALQNLPNQKEIGGALSKKALFLPALDPIEKYVVRAFTAPVVQVERNWEKQPLKGFFFNTFFHEHIFSRVLQYLVRTYYVIYYYIYKYLYVKALDALLAPVYPSCNMSQKLNGYV